MDKTIKIAGIIFSVVIVIFLLFVFLVYGSSAKTIISYEAQEPYQESEPYTVQEPYTTQKCSSVTVPSATVVRNEKVLVEPTTPFPINAYDRFVTSFDVEEDTRLVITYRFDDNLNVFLTDSTAWLKCLRFDQQENKWIKNCDPTYIKSVREKEGRFDLYTTKTDTYYLNIKNNFADTRSVYNLKVSTNSPRIESSNTNKQVCQSVREYNTVTKYRTVTKYNSVTKTKEVFTFPRIHAFVALLIGTN